MKNGIRENVQQRQKNRAMRVKKRAGRLPRTSEIGGNGLERGSSGGEASLSLDLVVSFQVTVLVRIS